MRPYKDTPKGHLQQLVSCSQVIITAGDHSHQRRQPVENGLLVQCLIAIVCLAGCILQIWSLSATAAGGYFAYDVVTSVTVAYKNRLEYPTRTFCFYTVDIVNWTEILSDPKIQAKVARQSMMNFVQTTPAAFVRKARGARSHREKLELDALVKEFLPARTLMNMTSDYGDIFYACSYIMRRNYTVATEPCDEIYDIKKFMLKTYTCFEMSPRKHREYDLGLVQLVYAYNPGMVSAISLKKSFYSHVQQSMLYVHDLQELPSTQNPRSIAISEMDRLFSVSYTEYESVFLPRPYPSNCRNYTAEGLVSRVNCINDCTAKRTRKQLGYNSLIIPVTAEPVKTVYKVDDSYLDLLVLSDRQLLTNQTLFNATRAISNSCNNLCYQPDCDDTNVAPVLLSANAYPYNLYTFYLAYEPDVTTSTVEKTGITSYLSDIASALGFWMGISLLSSLETTSKIVRKIATG